MKPSIRYVPSYNLSSIDFVESQYQSLATSTPNGLPGIPVSSGGNYNDASGQQWICDTIDYAKGVYTQRIGKIDSYASDEISGEYMSTTGELSEGATVLYAMAESIETALSTEELVAFKALGNPAGNAVVYSEANLSVDLSDIASSNAVDNAAQAANNAQSSATAAQNTASGAEERVTVAESQIQQIADMIATLVTDGNGASLMTQTENGWTFSVGEITDTLSTATEDIDTLSGQVDSANSSINTLQQAVDDLGVMADYVVITSYNDQPCIELGERDNNFKLRITNTEIQFADGTTIPAYLSNQKLYIEKAEVKDELQHGGFVWKKRSNGNLGLLWKGDS